jgi:hypothetical protein
VFRIILSLVGLFHMVAIWGAEFDWIWYDMDHKPRDILNDPFGNYNLGSEPDWKVGSREQYTNAVHSISHKYHEPKETRRNFVREGELGPRFDTIQYILSVVKAGKD